jgi:hypothetical protein
MQMDPIIVGRLRGLCQSWGGTLVEVPEAKLDEIEKRELDRNRRDFYPAPFANDLGVFWRRKRIVYTTVPADRSYAELVHEMGHTFACTKNPEDSDEFDFFGWEYAVIRYVGGSTALWAHTNRFYSVENGGRELGSLSEIEVYNLVQERVAHARTLGILNGYTPLAVR